MAINFGNFGNIDPEGMQAIKEALARRGMGEATAALNQQSGVSPTPAPLPTQPAAGQAMPDTSQVPQQATPVQPMSNDEARLIVSALKDRLKSISQLELGG